MTTAASIAPSFSSSPLPAASQLQVSNGAHFDVVIIGSGAGGGTLARHLAEHSQLKVLVLERGDWLPQERENWDAEGCSPTTVARAFLLGPIRSKILGISSVTRSLCPG